MVRIDELVNAVNVIKKTCFCIKSRFHIKDGLNEKHAKK